MGRSTPIRQLYCSRCKKKWERQYALSNWNPEYWRWFNVSVIADLGNKALVRCGNCGYEYHSRSIAALRQLDSVRKMRGSLDGE